jgi:Glycosyltransferase family 87
MVMVEREMVTSGDVYKRLKVAGLFLLTVAVLAFIAYLLVGKELNGIDDFRSCYIVGMKVRTGHVFDLYDVSSYPVSAPFLRAAWEALIFVPFTFFSYQTAFNLWTTLNIVLFGISGWLMKDEIRTALEENQLLRRIAVIALLIPIGETLAFGQDAALFLLLIVLALRSARAGRDFDAGIWLGLASINLHLLLPLFLLIVLRRRWRMVQSIALTGTFLFLISIALAGPYWIPACIHAQANVTDQMGYETARYLLMIAGVHRLTLLFLMAGVIASLWLVRNMAFERAAAWMIVSAIFFNWHSFFFDYSCAMPAFVLREPGG